MSLDELRTRLKNVHTYAVTPFKKDDLLAVDLEGMAGNLEFLVEAGVQVIAVGGGTGEIEMLSSSELLAVARMALDVVQDRALVVACLPGNIKRATQLASRYEQLGVEVLMAMPPLVRAQAPTDLDGVLEYYRSLANASQLPIMPYNTQGWPVEFFVRLGEIERILAVKDPCQDPHTFFQAIKRLGDRFVWLGNKRHDPGVLQYRYQAGMEGFTSGQTNFHPGPELMMHQAGVAGDWPLLIQLQERVAPLERLRMAHDDAAMVKAAMDLVGLCGGRVRPPRRDVTPKARQAIRKVLQSINGL